MGAQVFRDRDLFRHRAVNLTNLNFAGNMLAEARLECESGAAGEQENRNPNVKSYAAFSAFVLGLTVGMFGLLAVQHTMADGTTPSFLKKSFVANSVPVKNGVQPVSATAMTQDEGLNEGRSTATMMESMLEPSSSFSPAFSSSGSACSRRNALGRAAAVAAAVIGAPAFAAPAMTIKMGTDGGQLQYVPSEATICKGDSVTWVMNKAGPHNVQFNEVPDGVELEGSELIGTEGEKFTQKFDVAGDYSYFCSPHGGAGMVGQLTVKA